MTQGGERERVGEGGSGHRGRVAGQLLVLTFAALEPSLLRGLLLGLIVAGWEGAGGRMEGRWPLADLHWDWKVP